MNDRLPKRQQDETAPDELAAEVVEHDHQPDECTLYPADAVDEALVTMWITAQEGSYVDLESMR